MTDRLPPGPYKTLSLTDGTAIPFYIIPFDKEGRCEGPATRAHLIDAVRDGSFTDIYLFSHGWNDDWSAATERYESFIGGYMKMRSDRGLPAPAPYRPLLVGIFWPSTALVFGEKEKGPGFAGAGVPDAGVAAERREVAEIAAALPDEHVERFYELAQKPALGEAEALELARIALTLPAQGGDEITDEVSSPEDLVRLWKLVPPVDENGGKAPAEPKGDDDFGTADAAGGPQAAGVFDFLDPRLLIRLFTAWQMKDRAGVVGFRGVGPLLRELLAAGQARLHLIGHSYGGKVLLSATASAELPRPVETMLLLEPAVSHLCFADRVPSTDRPGGYRSVLSRVRKPILSTFSSRDIPLTVVFHLAVRRADDLGELRIAAEGEPPSKFAALGGYGPRHAGEQLVDIKDPLDRYALPMDGPRIYGLRGDRTIGGHGDISNESTWWALYNLVSA